MASNLTKLALRMESECPAHRVRQAARLLTRAYDEGVRSLGIQMSQLSVLTCVALAGEDGAPMGTLAQGLVMDQTTLSRNVRPLEKAGFLRVARSATDARARVVTLTRAGERIVESSFALWEAAHKRVKRTLGADAMTTLHQSLSNVVDHATELDPALRSAAE